MVGFIHMDDLEYAVQSLVLFHHRMIEQDFDLFEAALFRQ